MLRLSAINNAHKTGIGTVISFSSSSYSKVNLNDANRGAAERTAVLAIVVEPFINPIRLVNLGN